MSSLGPVVDVAIPHEAGHILVGRVVGLHARGLDVEVVRFYDPDRIGIGNFATLAFEPRDEQIPDMDPELRAAFMLFVGSGVAGTKFCGLTTIDSGADADRTSRRWAVPVLRGVAGQRVGGLSKTLVGILPSFSRCPQAPSAKSH